MAQVQYQAVGRRKKAIARVRLVPGDGKVVINGRDIDNYFGLETLKMTVRQPLALTNLEVSLRCAGQRVWRWPFRPGRRDPSRHCPRAREGRSGAPPGGEEGWLPHARSAHEGAQEVRPQGCTPRAAVLQALIRLTSRGGEDIWRSLTVLSPCCLYHRAHPHRYRSASAGRIQWPGCDCGRRRDVLWKEQGEVDGG